MQMEGVIQRMPQLQQLQKMQDLAQMSPEQLSQLGGQNQQMKPVRKHVHPSSLSLSLTAYIPHIHGDTSSRITNIPTISWILCTLPTNG